ncbi:putative S-layer protein [Xenococcus sp. PCC 7305]|uniref:iron uptake porin n=1 Tax=Xenococcus sp. PCC 7305 TaxID=102125 RepID=UPI0002ABC30B|nr:iron uptake porin [Xenococcus sp. PCC 7305]ELS01756.1 putative S-layer protein [Xenococcus sp. PCC 7305]
MSKLFWGALKAAPAVLVSSVVATNAAMAQTVASNESSVDATLEQIDHYNKAENHGLSQVTNVNQLRDVSPADWAYEALRSLVDRYGCIVGYPDQTYKGNQALSRYEFAAGLNACLNQIERLIASSEAVLREDIETINRLLQEFEAELATLGGRVDSLEGRVAFLEDHQFSTTTKLKGEVIFALGQSFGDDINSQVTFSDRVRLNFDSSFTGKDRLRTRLQAGNISSFRSDITGTDSTRVGFDANTGNNLELDDLTYRFPAGDKVRVWLGANSLGNHNVLETGNPYFASSGTGALSRFGRRNPLIFRTTAGVGAGANIKLTDSIKFNAAYLTNNGDGADPSQGEGLFNGSYAASAQFVVSPFEKLDLNVAYVRSFQTGDDVNFGGSTTSGNAKRPFGRVDTSSHHIGLGGNYQLGERVAFAAWGGYASATNKEGNGTAGIWTWNANVAFPDLGKEGAVAGIGVGMTPQLTAGDNIVEDEDTSLLIEALYKFPVNKNIIVTPGAYVVTNPNSDSDNDAVWVGLIRTTFKF